MCIFPPNGEKLSILLDSQRDPERLRLLLGVSKQNLAFKHQASTLIIYFLTGKTPSEPFCTLHLVKQYPAHSNPQGFIWTKRIGRGKQGFLENHHSLGLTLLGIAASLTHHGCAQWQQLKERLSERVVIFNIFEMSIFFSMCSYYRSQLICMVLKFLRFYNRFLRTSMEYIGFPGSGTSVMRKLKPGFPQTEGLFSYSFP